MSPEGPAHEGGRIATERDFYRRLLDLGGEQEIEPLLDQALALIVEVTEASMAYVELYDDDSIAPRYEPRYWKGHRLSDQDMASIRASISRGIIARAITEGRTIETPSATDDDRFANLSSVRQHAIQAVLCAPVGKEPARDPGGPLRARRQGAADRRHLPPGPEEARHVHGRGPRARRAVRAPARAAGRPPRPPRRR
jgi:hypothetical protein